MSPHDIEMVGPRYVMTMICCDMAGPQENDPYKRSLKNTNSSIMTTQVYL